MPPSGRYDYHDLKPAAGSFLSDVVGGLSAQNKALPPKYLYDARGSELFEAICELPEYYPTRTELAMLQERAPEIAGRAGTGGAIVEYGSGSGRKTRLLVEVLQPRTYVAVDISGEQLRTAVAQLAQEFPRVRMHAVCADYTQALPIKQLDEGRSDRRVVFFPGSTVGNFSIPEATAFLVNARNVAGAGGAMLVGVDLKKDRRVLHAAYNDSNGVTAQFNLNVLRRINDELGADFDLAAFEHRAHYDPDLGRIEMHLVSKRTQDVRLGSHTFSFVPGETIHTENSYKYSIAEFQALARKSGFEPEYFWTDSHRLFSIHYLAVPS